jgi:hypothetical protein
MSDPIIEVNLCTICGRMQAHDQDKLRIWGELPECCSTEMLLTHAPMSQLPAEETEINA